MQPCPPPKKSIEGTLEDIIAKRKRRRTAHSKAFDSDLLTSNGQASEIIFNVDINDPGDNTVQD